jgi:hypothetical protein
MFSGKKKVENQKELEFYIRAVSILLENTIKGIKFSDDAFAGDTVAPIPLNDYLWRFATEAPTVFDSENYIIMLIYIDRFIQNNSYTLTGYNIHRLAAIALLESMKFHNDTTYNNAFIARIAGIPTIAEINELELEFLFGIGFELNITSKIFQQYRNDLCQLLINNRQNSDKPDEAKRIDFKPS